MSHSFAPTPVLMRKYEDLAHESRTIQKLGYYHEMHMFEGADWSEQAELRHTGKLRKMYEERVDRIKHCYHKI